jgi:hypothetical protein
LRVSFISAAGLLKADDWRPNYHLSPAAELLRLGAKWLTLGNVLQVNLLDGWRFSDNPESDWYTKNISLIDPTTKDSLTGDYENREVTEHKREVASQYRQTIDGQQIYRMRHVSNMRIKIEAQLMAPPAFSDRAICVEPNDIIVRRVGKVAAGLITQNHRRHPIDANLVIIRGLDTNQAIWLTFCLNQTVYKSFLEQQHAISNMVRVSLQKLELMPIAPCPNEFFSLADKFQQSYQIILSSEESLLTLRKSVLHWVEHQIGDDLSDVIKASTEPRPEQLDAKFFSAKDINHQLTYSAAEQAHLARLLAGNANCKMLGQLAQINPKPIIESVKVPYTVPVIKIKDLDGQQSMHIPKVDKKGGWRVHKRLLNQFDVLVSTFVQDPKVALAVQPPKVETQISEQIAVLKFHHSPGAYALLMETPLIRKQIEWLSTGMVQRFVQAKMFEQIVLPEIDQVQATTWHQQLGTLLEAKSKATKDLNKIYQDMYQVYRKVHPVSEFSSPAPQEEGQDQ